MSKSPTVSQYTKIHGHANAHEFSSSAYISATYMYREWGTRCTEIQLLLDVNIYVQNN